MGFNSAFKGLKRIPVEESRMFAPLFSQEL
jgi:hypothetical protein